MNYYPIFVDVRGRPCWVIGGGEVAERKVSGLRRSGAAVHVIATTLTATLRKLADKDEITWQAMPYDETAPITAFLVIAATDDHDLNARVAERCQREGILVNVVDGAGYSSFISPAVVDRSPLIFAISSGGASPVLARYWRARLEVMIPAAYGRLATLVGAYRAQVKQIIPRMADRLRFWERVLDSAVVEQMLAGHDDQAATLLESQLEAERQAKPSAIGEVYLVGSGPGDPDLLTFRALRLMQKADVVLYDRLVSPQIMTLVRQDAQRIYVGKARSDHAVPQDQINDLLVQLARQGHRVLRLKGGDPFIFGRGGEEIEKLAEAGVPFQIVPGITAASGCAAYAGIPLTHRDYAQSCHFVTGHPRQDGSLNLDWSTLAQRNQTVVIYMGLTGLSHLCQQLREHGLPDDYPVAIIQQGTTPAQRVLVSSLKAMPALAEQANLRPPTLVIVGEVVQLHTKLAWFRSDGQVASVFGENH